MARFFFFFFFSGGGLTPTVCQAPGPSDTPRGRLGDSSVSGRLASNGLVPPRSVSGRHLVRRSGAAFGAVSAAGPPDPR